jgi:hypothetical protein
LIKITEIVLKHSQVNGKFKDTNRVIRRQYNGQTKEEKKGQLMISNHYRENCRLSNRNHINTWVRSGSPEGLQPVPASLVAHIV